MYYRHPAPTVRAFVQTETLGSYSFLVSNAHPFCMLQQRSVHSITVRLRSIFLHAFYTQVMMSRIYLFFSSLFLLFLSSIHSIASHAYTDLHSITTTVYDLTDRAVPTLTTTTSKRPDDDYTNRHPSSGPDNAAFFPLKFLTPLPKITKIILTVT